MPSKLSELEDKLGYRFNDQNILNEAITHSSLRTIDASIKHYERLEHLGDTVIQMVITEYLFKFLRNANEGTLSTKRAQLVGRIKQTEIANELQLSRYINKSPGLMSNFNRYDQFVEAIIGAVYVDAGFGGRGLDKAKPIIFKLWQIQEPSKYSCAIM